MQGDKVIGIIIMVAIFLGVFYALSSCTESGEKYYHVPSVEVEVEVDKGRKHYKPAPKPHFGSGTTTRKR